MDFTGDNVFLYLECEYCTGLFLVDAIELHIKLGHEQEASRDSLLNRLVPIRRAFAVTHLPNYNGPNGHQHHTPKPLNRKRKLNSDSNSLQKQTEDSSTVDGDNECENAITVKLELEEESGSESGSPPPSDNNSDRECTSSIKRPKTTIQSIMAPTRTALSVNDKRAICELRAQHPDLTLNNFLGFVREILNLDVGRSTIWKILKCTDRWLATETSDSSKLRLRPAKFPELEKACVTWFNTVVTKGIEVTDKMFVTKARQLANGMGITEQEFKCSPGWLQKLKCRHGLRWQVKHGESLEVQESTAQFG